MGRAFEAHRGQDMAGLNMGSINDDPVQIVRTMARIAQMLVELRDEYVESKNDDTLDQIDRRLDELHELQAQLRTRRENDAA
jgi:prephenate dehydrogenase